MDGRDQASSSRHEVGRHSGTRGFKPFCTLVPGAKALLQRAIDQLRFSARAYVKVLRVARTLADLYTAETIEDRQIGEANQDRNLDRQSS